MSRSALCVVLLGGLTYLGSVGSFAETSSPGVPYDYGIGRPATATDIRPWDIDVSPNGQGLPSGSGTVQMGRQLYLERCASCHGKNGREGPMNKLVGGQGTLNSPNPVKTIGSYWPYATTLYDYVYRAMPFGAPQSLKPNEVYSIVAWILYQNGIIREDDVMNGDTLAAVKMPNRNGFVPDPRPDILAPTRR